MSHTLHLDFSIPNWLFPLQLPAKAQRKHPGPNVKTVRAKKQIMLGPSLTTLDGIGGAVHKEIFAFTRVKSGSLMGKEWESVVKPVIEKWGLFVETYM